ncbi:MAG TPA: hypothetical protein VGL92_11000, partial [Acidimicrobiia bacterium]
MSKTGTTARWTASTGASLVLMVAVALMAAPVVSAGPGDGGGSDPLAGLIGGDGPGFFGGGEGGGGQSVHGRAMSRGDTDSYGLGLQARGEGDKAHGRLVFGHRAASGGGGFGPRQASGGEGFGGEITCLSIGDDGVVQVSGTTREGHGHGRRGDHGGKEGEPGQEREPGQGGEPEPQPAAFGHGAGHDGAQDGTGDESAAGKDFA